MSENTTKQFLDKDGLDTLWNKICQTFIPKDGSGGTVEIQTISEDMIDIAWDDVIGIEPATIDYNYINNSKLT